MRSIGRIAAACCATAMLAAAGCGSDDDGGSGGGSGGGTIKVGAISSLTGPLQFPETQQAAKAVFDQVNADGGVNGKRIDFVVEDDKGQPAVASQAARRLVDQEKVVAFAGGTSLASCAVNNRFYQQKNILAVEGTGVLQQCFTSSNIAPVNPGPFTSYTSLLYFASEVQKHEKVCAIILNVPGLNDGYLKALDRWKSMTGKEPAATDNSLGIADDPTPAVVKMKRAGCEAVVFNANEPQVAPMIKAAKDQGFLKGVDWITLTSGYTAAVGEALKKQGTTGVYANSEYEPFTNDSEALTDWRTLMEKNDIPLTSFAEGGYLSAQILVEALKGIKGNVTRESVTEALHGVTAYESPLLGMPFSFAEGDAHNPNQAVKFVRVGSDGKWKSVSDDFLKLPAA